MRRGSWPHPRSTRGRAGRHHAPQCGHCPPRRAAACRRRAHTGPGGFAAGAVSPSMVKGPQCFPMKPSATSVRAIAVRPRWSNRSRWSSPIRRFGLRWTELHSSLPSTPPKVMCTASASTAQTICLRLRGFRLLGRCIGRMSYREVSVIEIREILRLWLQGVGFAGGGPAVGHGPQDGAPVCGPGPRVRAPTATAAPVS